MSRLVVTNLSRTYDYTLTMNGKDVLNVAPLRTAETDIDAGEYDLAVSARQHDEIPGTCKPIHVTIGIDKTLRLQVETRQFAIEIYDEGGTLLNGKRGFVCGRVGDGVYVTNPIG